MTISQAALAQLYINALLLGALLAFAYDLLRITRVFLGVHYSRSAAKRLQGLHLPILKPFLRHRESRALGIVMFFEDFIFCLLAAVSMILLFYQANNGKFRFPAVFAAGAGFLLYRGTLGRFVMLTSEFIAFGVEALVRYVAFFLTLPCRKLAKWGCGLAQSGTRAFVRARRKTKRRRYTTGQLARLDRDACGMIPPNAKHNQSPKRGKYVAKGKKTIQLNAADARSVSGARGGFHRGVRQ